MKSLVAPLVAIILAGCTVTTTPGPTPAAASYPPPPPAYPRPEPRPPTVVVTPPATPPTSPRPPAAAPWQKLGELTVDGRSDRDRLAVGRYEGRFRKVMIRVERSAMRMHGVNIVFTDGSSYSPRVDYYFTPGQTQAIDLPGNRRAISRIDFRYSDVQGGKRARVQIWGR
ncbi:MAG: hypothetical protein HOW73_30025 [Polyangiaceae bacterium]|nr:hypothetical protein [Polyangiaceae bacterium]